LHQHQWKEHVALQSSLLAKHWDPYI